MYAIAAWSCARLWSALSYGREIRCTHPCCQACTDLGLRHTGFEEIEKRKNRDETYGEPRTLPLLGMSRAFEAEIPPYDGVRNLWKERRV